MKIQIPEKVNRIIGTLTFAGYEEGMKLVKSCNEKIERIEKKILVLSGEEAGNGAGAEEQENELRF